MQLLFCSTDQHSKRHPVQPDSFFSFHLSASLKKAFMLSNSSFIFSISSLASPINDVFCSSIEKFVVNNTTMAIERKAPEKGGLEGIEDNNGGISVEMTEPMDPITFLTLLRASITQWKEQNKKSVWIKLPIELVNLVEPAVKEGFHYHHAETRYLMLVYWIPDTAPKLPANASHRVGIGAFLMNNNGEVLVVQENKGKFRGTGIWKLPTGVVNEGEDIPAAAIREVKEETGIESEFLEVLAFRQSHNSFFSKSDLFFVCLLKPLSFTIQQQNSEVEAAQWMAMEEYAAQPFVQKKEIFHQIAKICLAKISNKYRGFSPVLTTSGFSNKKFYLYFYT